MLQSAFILQISPNLVTLISTLSSQNLVPLHRQKVSTQVPCLRVSQSESSEQGIIAEKNIYLTGLKKIFVLVLYNHYNFYIHILTLLKVIIVPAYYNNSCLSANEVLGFPKFHKLDTDWQRKDNLVNEKWRPRVL